MFWGFTPCLDLLSQYEEKLTQLPEELNILIVGGSDARHILQTLAKRYRHKKVNINIFIAEACMECIARHILLLYIALQPSEELGLIQKTYTFMELYGNALIRPNIARYLRNVSQEFIKFVTNYDYMHQVLPYAHMDLKYRERDYLETLFKFWCSEDEFDICYYWDRRMRQILGVRYDNKIGAFDWDLHMRFHIVGGQQVTSHEYKNFRLNGISFSWLESDVSKTNRSLVCGVIPNGDKFAHHGYLGDMQTGPYVSYGLECEDKEFLKKNNGVNTHRASDVTDRNLKQIFYELENQGEYIHQKICDLQPGSIVKICETKVVDSKGCSTSSQKKTQSCLTMKDVSLNFISVQCLKQMEYKEDYRNKFDVIYFSSTHVNKYLENSILQKISKGTSLLIIENKKYALNLRDKDLESYEAEIDDKMKNSAFTKLNFDVHKDDYVFYSLRDYQ